MGGDQSTVNGDPHLSLAHGGTADEHVRSVPTRVCCGGTQLAARHIRRTAHTHSLGTGMACSVGLPIGSVPTGTYSSRRTHTGSEGRRVIRCATRAPGSAQISRDGSSPFLSTQADWRGRDNTFSALLSAPGVHFAVLTADTDFKLPTVKLVHGSFMIKVAWVMRGHSNRRYAILSNASEIGFDVLDANQDCL